MGLLGDMAKAAAKVAINQVSNTAHEKVSEMFPTKEIVLSGSHERDVYTYYGGPLKGIRVGQTFDAEVAKEACHPCKRVDGDRMEYCRTRKQRAYV